jgi:hypothetical protein
MMYICYIWELHYITSKSCRQLKTLPCCCVYAPVGNLDDCLASFLDSDLIMWVHNDPKHVGSLFPGEFTKKIDVGICTRAHTFFLPFHVDLDFVCAQFFSGFLICHTRPVVSPSRWPCFVRPSRCGKDRTEVSALVSCVFSVAHALEKSPTKFI